MKLTNTKDMPQIIIDAAMSSYSEDRSTFDYSTTTLIAPPRQVQLLRRHKNEIEEDIVNWWYAFLGNSIHTSLEKSLKNNPEYICEKRVVLTENDAKVGMRFDAYHIPTKTLYDYKITSTFIRGLEMKPEWVEQVNLYAYCLTKMDKPVEKAYIVVFYKDWREASSKYKSEDVYPKRPISLFEIPLWSFDEQEKFYYSKLREHQSYEDVPDDSLPDCSDEALWETPAKYAVFRKGADRAMKLCDSLPEAQSYISYKKLSNVGVEFREGKRKRCADYCSAAPFCNQYKKWLAEQERRTSEAITFDVNVA